MNGTISAEAQILSARREQELAMRSALYYPHTEIESRNLLKTALLLWDQVYIIAPWPGYQPHYGSQEESEAFEVIGQCHFPTEDEKRHAHELVEDFATRALPDAFTLPGLHKELKLPGIDKQNDQMEFYEISTQKLLPETWKLLGDCGLADVRHRTLTLVRDIRSGKQSAFNDRLKRSEPFEPDDANTRPWTGLSLMAILADCCAGSTLARITDKGVAYATITGLLLEGPDEQLEIGDAREQLVPMPMRVVAGDAISMNDLVNLRKREAGNADGHSIRDLRHRLADKVEQQAKRLSIAKSSLERSEILREFEQDIQDDYRDLREVLKSKTLQALGTKEVLMSVLTAAGAIAAAALAPVTIPGTLAWSGAAVTIGGLLSAKSKFAEERAKILKDHPTAYIYESLGGIKW
jgi:hypothetical protein